MIDAEISTWKAENRFLEVAVLINPFGIYGRYHRVYDQRYGEYRKQWMWKIGPFETGKGLASEDLSAALDKLVLADPKLSAVGSLYDIMPNSEEFVVKLNNGKLITEVA